MRPEVENGYRPTFPCFLGPMRETTHILREMNQVFAMLNWRFVKRHTLDSPVQFTKRHMTTTPLPQLRHGADTFLPDSLLNWV